MGPEKASPLKRAESLRIQIFPNKPDHSPKRIHVHQVSSLRNNMFLQKVSIQNHFLGYWALPHALNKTSILPPFSSPSQPSQPHPGPTINHPTQHLGIGPIHLFAIIQHLHRDASLFLHVALVDSLVGEGWLGSPPWGRVTGGWEDLMSGKKISPR